MKKIFFTVLVAFCCIQVGYAIDPTIAESTIRKNIVTGKYEVFVKFDANGPISFGNSMITIIMPEEADDQAIVITPVNGGGWVEGSTTFNNNGFDYHGIFTTGTPNMDYMEGSEMKLFEFYCEANISPRLWMLGTDDNQTPDGTDYISHFYIPQTGFYIIPEVYGEISTGVEYLGNDEMSIFPNPAVDNIKVKLLNVEELGETAIVKVIETASGKVLITKEMPSVKLFSLDIAKLPSGAYTIQFLSDNKINASGEFVKIVDK